MRLFILILFFAKISICKAQVSPLKLQESIANKFIDYLESRDVDNALLLVDFGRTNDSIILRKKLEVAVNEIGSIKSKTFPLIMLVKDKNHNIYRCRYINEKEKYDEFYQIDVMFAKTGVGKIKGIACYDRKTLIREQIMREKSANEIPPEPPVIKQ